MVSSQVLLTPLEPELKAEIKRRSKLMQQALERCDVGSRTYAIQSVCGSFCTPYLDLVSYKAVEAEVKRVIK